MRVSVFFIQLSELTGMAWKSILLNKTRSLLSLSGISIGIFSIILVFTITDSLEKGIRKSIRSLGSDVIYVQKWPWIFGGEYPWWKYIARPYPTFEEYQFIEKKANTIREAGFIFTARRKIKADNKQIDRITICGISHSYPQIRNMQLEEGRFFNKMESDNGSRCVVVGNDIAEALFPAGNALDNYLSVSGIRCRIIGILKKEGKSMFGLSSDRQVFMPYTLMVKFINPKSEFADPLIICKVKEDVTVDRGMDEIENILRAKRRIKPTMESTFALNKITLLEKGFDDLFVLISLVGWIIGGFSILVGGFGIANIMYVSVSERIQQIGIQMSLGATRYFVLMQFLLEGIFLCLAGGAIGLSMTAALVLLMHDFSGLELALSWSNVGMAFQLSFLVGVVSSFVPSYEASQLDPVEAMRR
ncbi:MAG: ABC transporter permease [Bacteroidia bacterium]|nr:ABC transporter permease [Bacteroidia bacterium]